jgi:hypothetical protein
MEVEMDFSRDVSGFAKVSADTEAIHQSGLIHFF